MKKLTREEYDLCKEIIKEAHPIGSGRQAIDKLLDLAESVGIKEYTCV